MLIVWDHKRVDSIVFQRVDSTVRGTDQYLESFLHILREGWHQQVTSPYYQIPCLNAGGIYWIPRGSLVVFKKAWEKQTPSHGPSPDFWSDKQLTSKQQLWLKNRLSTNEKQNPTGWWLSHPSEKYESQLGWLFNIWKNKKCSKPPTSQYSTTQF